MSRAGYIPAGAHEARSTIDLCIASVFSVIERHRLDTDGTLRESLERLKARAASNEICLAILGEFSSGETSFINTLLDTDILETGILPTTAVCTYIRYGADVSCELFLTDGTILPVKPSDLRADATLDLGKRSLDHVTLKLPASLLSLGLTVVDTPGVNVNIDVHEAITRHAIQGANACVYMMDARQPGKKTTIEFLRRIQEQINKTFFVLNRADILDAEEQQEALEFVTSALREECGILQPKIMLLSSRTRLNENPELWSERFDEFQQMLQDFMRSQRDTVIYAELARLLAETIELSEGLLSSKYRLAESELSAHYEVALPDAAEVLFSLREQSTAGVIEDSTNIKTQFYKFHDEVCRSLRDRVEGKISTTRTTAGLVEVGSTQIGKAFEEHANQLQMFLNSSFVNTYARRQAQVRASIAGLFSGVQWVDHKALFSRPAPWICILTGAVMAIGVEFLAGAPFVDQAISPFLGATIAAVGYGIYHWVRNRSSFSPPRLPKTMHSDSAWAVVASGAIYQNAAANPIKENMAPVHLGRAVGAASGNPLFAVVGASVSAGILGFQLLVDKLSGRLDKMRNEMRSALKPVLDDFERKTRENGAAAITAGESTTLEALSFVLDMSMQRYQVVLDRLLRPHRHIQERLEQRRNEIQFDSQNLRKLQEQVLSSRSLLVAEMKGISPTYSDVLPDPLASEANSSSMLGSNKVRHRVQLLDAGQVAESFRGDRSLIFSWFGCLITAIILAAASLNYAGAFRASRVPPAAIVPGAGADVQKSSASSDLPRQATPTVTDDYAAIHASLLAEGYLADGPMTDIQGVATGTPLHTQKVSCTDATQPCEKLFVFAGPRAVWSESLDPKAEFSLTSGTVASFTTRVSKLSEDGSVSVETAQYKWDGSLLAKTVNAAPDNVPNTDSASVGSAATNGSVIAPDGAPRTSSPPALEESSRSVPQYTSSQSDSRSQAPAPKPPSPQVSATTLHDSGLEYARMGYYKSAIGRYDEALRLNPSYAQAYTDRGTAYLNLGRYTEAIENFDRALDLDAYQGAALTGKRLAQQKLSGQYPNIKQYASQRAITRSFQTTGGAEDGTLIEAGKRVFELQHYHLSDMTLHRARLTLSPTSLAYLPEGPCKYPAFAIPLTAIKSVDVGRNFLGEYLLNIKYEVAGVKKSLETKGQLSFAGPYTRILPGVSPPPSAQETTFLTTVKDAILASKSAADTAR
jgi:tetratricopeptide (TPR) repeat protein